MQIVIVGLGVIGGGLAMALKDAGGHEVFGVDIHAQTVQTALDMGIIEKGCTAGDDLLPQADLTIITLYPDAVMPWLRSHSDQFNPGSVVTDVTGVKTALARDAQDSLPKGVDFVMCHPMAGREKSGIDYASAKVFQNANFLITPLPHNREENIEMLENLAKHIGFGRVRRIDPFLHDELIAFTSQLPHAMAVALVNSDPDGEETGQFVGDSYRELTRIANINAPLWCELFMHNRENLLKSIGWFEDELHKIKAALEQGDSTTLISLFEESTRRREKLDV